MKSSLDRSMSANLRKMRHPKKPKLGRSTSAPREPGRAGAIVSQVFAALFAATYLVLGILAYNELGSFTIGEMNAGVCMTAYIANAFLGYIGFGSIRFIAKYRDESKGKLALGIIGLIVFILLSVGSIVLSFKCSGGFGDMNNTIVYYPIAAVLTTIIYIVAGHFFRYDKDFWYPLAMLLVPTIVAPLAVIAIMLVIGFYILKFFFFALSVCASNNDTKEYTYRKDGMDVTVTSSNGRDFYNSSGTHIGTSDDGGRTIYED